MAVDICGTGSTGVLPAPLPCLTPRRVTFYAAVPAGAEGVVVMTYLSETGVSDGLGGGDG